ncbi:MAG: DsbA family protein [Emticicia sp.]
MKIYIKLLVLSVLLNPCNAQMLTKMQNSNPMLCDIETGICGTETSESTVKFDATIQQKSIKVIYFTDPICSSCWGIEPQLRRMKLEYGEHLEVEYHMGGLLKDWSYNSGGISKPSDVAHHWDEVSHHYEMPIDGDVWLEDPLPSSYPPSIAFKAAQIQDNAKAILFLRKIREMVFLEKKNITKWQFIEQAAQEVGLDAVKLKQDFDGKAQTLFQEDLALARQMGVRGFPSLFFTDKENNALFLYGAKPYSEFENKLKVLKSDITKHSFDAGWKFLFEHYKSLTAKEFAVLANKSLEEAKAELNKLTENHQLTMYATKNGNIWYLK